MSLDLLKRNQLNAQSSTGPSTEAGKLRSSQNAIKHGLYSGTVLLRTESREESDAFSTSLVDDLEPEGPMQLQLARVIADYLWRLRRPRPRIREIRQTRRTHPLQQYPWSSAPKKARLPKSTNSKPSDATSNASRTACRKLSRN